MNHRANDEAAIFEAALALNEAPQRKALLDAACRNDPQLRARVEELLAAEADARSFMQQAAVEFTVATFDTQPVEEPGSTIGRYKLLEQIGEGGFGVVYMADQLRPIERRVALKIIKRGIDSKQVVARFEAERQALALTDHPNIAKFLDAGATDTGRPYFVINRAVAPYRDLDYISQPRVRFSKQRRRRSWQNEGPVRCPVTRNLAIQ